MTGRRAFLSVGLVGVAVWLAADAPRSHDTAGFLAPPPVFAAVGDGAADRAETLLVQASHVRAGRDRSLSLTGEDLTALVRFGLPGVVPSGVIEPELSIERGVVRVSARLVHADFEAAEELGALASVLPDTASVTVFGRVSTGRAGWIDFRIEGAVVEGIPVPEVVLAAVARRLPLGRAGSAAFAGQGRRDDRPVLRVRKPHGLGSMYMAGHRLVVESAEPIHLMAVDEDSP